MFKFCSTLIEIIWSCLEQVQKLHFVPSRNFCQPAPACYDFHPAPQYGGGDKLNLGEGRTQADAGLNDILFNKVPISHYSAIDELDWKVCWRGSCGRFDSFSQ